MLNFGMPRKTKNNKRNKKSDKSRKTYQKYGKFSNKKTRIKKKNVCLSNRITRNYS